MDVLQIVAVFLGTTLLMVPLLKRLGLASVIGYLATGILLGPHALGLLDDPHVVLEFSEYGIVLLLFLIGIELEPSRLWVLRRSVFGMGALQVGLTGLVLSGLLLAADLSPAVSFIVGFGLALSSTAFALQLLSEKGQLNTRHGRGAFTILLFQDIAVIPLLALVPLLGGKGADYGWEDFGKMLLVGGLFILSSRVLVRPALRFVASAGTPEVFTAAALFLVCGAGLLTEFLGMSMSLGAFAAGVLLADSEYRHEIEASLLPIKSLLLGLFFIAVGMTADIELLGTETGLIIGCVLAMMAIKFLVLLLVGRLSGHNLHTSVQLAMPLAQGGEFAFVLFSAAAAQSLFSEAFAQRLILIVTLSMALTPFAFMLLEKVLEPLLRPRDNRAYDEVPEDQTNPVVIAGFGRFGQIVARVLRMHHIGFTALESDVRQVDFVRRFGNQVYYGNPANIELLRSAGVGRARVFVLAMDNVRDSVKTADAMHRHFPHVAVYARARDRAHAYQLMDLGVEVINRETYLSSLDLAQKILMALGLGEQRAEQNIRRFREYDEKLMLRQHAIHQDEAKLIESVKASMRELEDLFENDAMVAEAAATRAEPLHPET
ncbi:MAG: glutathione-regulated potassium-efflux system protein KefB [Moraxellaceae bacterium]|jgi:glutathione-regulated potassium-efflux system protein KefB|nr:glutathione-regulated potassium-efflux system protein KefB [Moraxellaceae bacterium]